MIVVVIEIIVVSYSKICPNKASVSAAFRGHISSRCRVTQDTLFHSNLLHKMIDSLFILGEDKQIVIEKHWKQTIDRSVLEPYFAALAKYVDSNVWIHFGWHYVSRIFLPFWKVASVPSLS